MDAPGAVARDRERHRLVVFAVKHADACRRTQVALLEEFEERGILLVNAQDFVRVANFCLGKFYSAMFAAETGHPAEKRHAVRAAAVASEPREEKTRYFGRDTVLETFRLFVRARPFEADNFREQLFGETVTQDQMLGRSLTLFGKFDAAAAPHAKIAGPGHPF